MNKLKRILPMYPSLRTLLELPNMDELFEGSLSNVETRDAWAPRVDIKESSDAYIVHADIPGVDKEDLDVDLEHNVLTIQGKRSTEKEEKDKDNLRIERFHGHFYRRFTLPDSCDSEKVSADYKNGVLTINIPKITKKSARKIKIRG